jgi:hypothetical protein
MVSLHVVVTIFLDHHHDVKSSIEARERMCADEASRHAVIMVHVPSHFSCSAFLRWKKSTNKDHVVDALFDKYDVLGEDDHMN